MSFDVPILFLVFNRPETTREVFQRIKERKPARLFIGADGPRKGEKEDNEKIREVRKLILDRIDWPCEVQTLFREKNLGCGLAVSSAITWFFENVKEGIILEDDCLPDPTFFDFCKALLDKYKHDEEIKMISGNNFQMGKWRGDGSYFFSSGSHIWGWATWRRTWAQYKYNLSYLDDQTVARMLDKHFKREKEKRYWKKIFLSVRNKEVDTWAYPLAFSIWHSNGLNIVPNQNLVSNIGFGENSTHTKNIRSILANIPVKPLTEIKHPSSITIDTEADQFLFDHYIGYHRPIFFRIKRKLRHLMKRTKLFFLKAAQFF